MVLNPQMAMSMPEPIRLSKRLIELLGCSRREAECYIEGGWVLVDGEVVEAPQFKVLDQRVELLPDAVAVAPEPVTLLLHLDADQTLDSVLPLLGTDNHWPDDHSGIRPLRRHFSRLAAHMPLPVGASGLQVLTQDWRVERKLKENQATLEQEYIVEVDGEIQAEGLERLNHGFRYRGRTVPAGKVSWQNEFRLRFAVKNPQPGQIEHQCEGVGLEVRAIKRLRIGGVSMSKLLPGQWRYLALGERF
jgi:23S rRNA pseudouridine2604 synthase